MKNTSKKIAATLLTATMMVAGALAVSADEAWPNGDVTVYVPANPGGSSDMIARLDTDAMSKITGANFVVVNDTTGANSVAYETVRNADPDGQTLMIYHGGMCTQFASGQYDHSLDEFDVVGGLTTSDEIGYGIYVNGKSEFETLDDLVAYAKENPNKLTAAVETNNMDHLIEGLFAKQFGIELNVVSGGSNTEKLPLLMGGNVDICFFTPAGNADYVTSGDLKCLASFGSVRSDLLPEVPTLTELGQEPILLPIFFFMAGPKGMSDEVKASIDSVIEQISTDEQIQEAVTSYGMQWSYLPIDEVVENAHEMQALYVEAFSLIH